MFGQDGFVTQFRCAATDRGSVVLSRGAVWVSPALGSRELRTGVCGAVIPTSRTAPGWGSVDEGKG